MNRKEVTSGVFVNQLPGDKFKRCKVSVHCILPSVREEATELALLPHILTRRCDAIQDPAELARYLFSLYGASISSDSIVVGGNRVVTVSVSGLKNAFALQEENLEAAYANLVCDLLFAPKLSEGVFTAEDVAIEKEKQAEYLKSERNEKRSYLLLQARRKLFGNSPLGVETSGYLEDIETLTAAKVFKVYQGLLSRATIEINVIGMDSTAIVNRIQKEVAKLHRAPVKPLAMEPIVGAGEFAYYAEPMDTIQGKLALLFTSNRIEDSHGDAVMRVASAVLGGLPTSRLFMNVREKQSLCYYCASVYNGYNGMLSIDSGVDHANCERAAEAILHELNVLQHELITEEELANAQKALSVAFTNASDSPDQLASWALAERLRGNNRTLEDFVQEIQTVTREEVQAALALFKPAVQYALTAKEAAQ